MYVCGPTVYGLLHVGNFRGPIFFNLVRNWLRRSGYKVTYAYNYTDVDDRIIQKAVDEGTTPEAIADRYIAEFQNDFTALKLEPHSMNPRVTETMGPIVAMVDELIKRDKAYVVDGEVLYSVRSFAGYGKLSNRNIDDLQAGARVEIDRKKRDPMDFALWKPAKPGEPKWASPWSEGRPGWHIECSAMIHSLLGESIDIHGGGSDLVFPHHENEIAQSEGATGRPFAKYWMHNNMLTFGDKKMSKSLGNIMTARDFLSRYNAEVMKFMILSVHYRSLSNFSEQGIHQAVSGLARVYSALALASRTIESAKALLPPLQQGQVLSALKQSLETEERAIVEALNDDFNTPEMFAAVYNVIRTFNAIIKPGAKVTADALASALSFRDWILDKGAMMSLFAEEPAQYLRLLDDMLLSQKSIKREDIDQVVLDRAAARAAKDFKRSDELRDQLLALGIAVQDTPLGSIWEVQKS